MTKDAKCNGARERSCLFKLGPWGGSVMQEVAFEVGPEQQRWKRGPLLRGNEEKVPADSGGGGQVCK